MSDNDMASPVTQANGGMSQADVDFLMCCLRNTTGGSIQVDTQRVAQLLNYKNPRSVSNKVSTIKKKYDLPFGASSRTAEEMASGNASKPGKGNTSKASDANGDNEPAVSTTPSKNRVTKSKATPKPRAATKKTPVKKSAKKVASESDEELTDVKDEDMEETKVEDDE
ncbi:hypothetical protein SBOR_9541 [Sclerotinia borealis F-4128]|uniref:Uncharacterized protein n=1 Tax=Sclerotinia borealis (strain F-4128) TaxID=1432307 RepID=W9BZS4_SCLBF|nr:hypothetical protein SBOR_9541 [Sclerotinia borealis F-4128]